MRIIKLLVITLIISNYTLAKAPWEGDPRYDCGTWNYINPPLIKPMGYDAEQPKNRLHSDMFSKYIKQKSKQTMAVASGSITDELRNNICSDYEIISVQMLKWYKSNGDIDIFGCNNSHLSLVNLSSSGTALDVNFACINDYSNATPQYYEILPITIEPTQYTSHHGYNLHPGKLKYILPYLDLYDVHKKFFVTRNYTPDGLTEHTSSSSYYNSDYLKLKQTLASRNLYSNQETQNVYADYMKKHPNEGVPLCIAPHVSDNTNLAYGYTGKNITLDNSNQPWCYHLDEQTSMKKIACHRRYLTNNDKFLMNYFISAANTENLINKLGGEQKYSEFIDAVKATGFTADVVNSTMPTGYRSDFDASYITNHTKFWVTVACKTEQLTTIPDGWDFFSITVPPGANFSSSILSKFNRPFPDSLQQSLTVNSKCKSNQDQCPSNTICIGNTGGETCQVCGYHNIYCCSGNTCASGLTCDTDSNICQKRVSIGQNCNTDFNINCTSPYTCDATINKCVSFVGEGEACDEANNMLCESPYQCVDGTCRLVTRCLVQ